MPSSDHRSVAVAVVGGPVGEGGVAKDSQPPIE
jgi:hypothetical protein